MEKLAGDLLLGLKFVKLEILSTSFIDFLYDKLGEFKSRSLVMVQRSMPYSLSYWIPLSFSTIVLPVMAWSLAIVLLSATAY